MTNRLSQLLQFLESDPTDPFNLYSVALEYQKTGAYQEAIRYFIRLREMHPQYVGLYYQLGNTYEKLAKENLALETYAAGRKVAQEIGDTHTFEELNRAIQRIEDEQFY